MAVEENPQLPAASREETAIADGAFIQGGRAVAAGNAVQWIASGWRLFRRQPFIWVLLTIVFGLIVIGLSVIPFIGQLALVLVGPVFVGGLMLGCLKVDRGEELELADLFAGFRRKTGSLITIALIGFALLVAVAVTVMLLTGASALFATFSGADPAMLMTSGTLLVFLLIMALTIPINMALWFAPALVLLQDQSPTAAIMQSFRACLKNIIPFLLYGVLLFVLAFVASIPLGLGWLVLGPVVIGSIYAAYRDIFLAS